jgi:hypothetical protein
VTACDGDGDGDGDDDDGDDDRSSLRRTVVKVVVHVVRTLVLSYLHICSVTQRNATRSSHLLDLSISTWNTGIQ